MQEESDIDEDFFAKTIVFDESGRGACVVDADNVNTETRPKLKWPSHPDCDGKGWLPQPYDTDGEMYRGSLGLLAAIKDRDWIKVNACLQRRVDLDFCNEDGACALHLAIAERHRDLVRFLLGQGANVTFATDAGFTALHYAVAHNDLRLVAVLLHVHALNGDSDKTVHKCTKDTGDNAVHLASLWGNVRIAKRLIRAGVDFTCKNKAGQTPLMIAEANGYAELCDYLKQAIEHERSQLEAERQRQCSSFPPHASNYVQMPIGAYFESGVPGSKPKVRFVDDDGDGQIASNRAEEASFWVSKKKRLRSDADAIAIRFWEQFDDVNTDEAKEA